MIRVAIAEDEPPARARIRKLVEERGDCEVIAESGDGQSALRMLLSNPVDVLFLDIQMPLLNGFEVLATLPKQVSRPVIIFSTAYKDHALEAFEVEAVDYLLKPWTPKRFNEAMDRAISRVADRSTNEASTQPPADELQITIRDGDKIHAVNASDIDYIESAGNYMVIHIDGDSQIHRETMTAMEKRLASQRFFRASRSFLVNLAKVREISKLETGKNLVVLKCGTEIPLTRPLKEFRAALEATEIS